MLKDNKCIAKIAFGGDLHKSYKDISTLKGYRSVCHLMQKDLNEELTKGQYTHFIHLGDWYHKGYREGVAQALVDATIDQATADAVNGNFYGLVGNHVRLELQTNPEIYLSQGDGLTYAKHDYNSLYADIVGNPPIRTPKEIMIGGLQIVLLHHLGQDDMLSNYKVKRRPDADVLIVLGHSEALLPRSIVPFSHLAAQDSYDLMSVLGQADFFISGHIHKPQENYMIGDCLCMIPGSMSNTSVTKEGLRDTFRMPIVEVYQNNTTGKTSVKWSFKDMPMHIEKLKIVKSNIEKGRRRLTQAGKNITELHKHSEIAMNAGIISSLGGEFTSLNVFMKTQGYTASQRDSIMKVIKSPKDTAGIIEAINKERVQ